MNKIDLQELFDLEAKESSFLNFIDFESKHCPLLKKHFTSKKHDKFKYRLVKKVVDNLDINGFGELISQDSPQRTVFEKMSEINSQAEAKEIIDRSEDLTKDQKEFLESFVHTINTGLNKNTFYIWSNLR